MNVNVDVDVDVVVDVDVDVDVVVVVDVDAIGDVRLLRSRASVVRGSRSSRVVRAVLVPREVR